MAQPTRSAHPTADALRELRKRVKAKGTIKQMADKVGMVRTELNRILGPETIEKLEKVEEVVGDE